MGLKNLHEGLKTLEKGMVWEVGEGTKINIWKDPRIPSLNYKPINEIWERTQLNQELRTVDNIMQNGTWSSTPDSLRRGASSPRHLPMQGS